MVKTTDEKIMEATEKKQQLENQIKNLLQQKKAEDRKARTKRLIERGAILESLIPGADTLINEQIKAFLEKTILSENAVHILNIIKAQPAPEPPPIPVQSAEPPSGADGGRTGDAATSGD
jgi:hypothetical protein